MTRLIQEWKIHFSPLTGLPALGLAVYLHSISGSTFTRNMRELYLLFEMMWPLALMLGVAVILPSERDAGVIELRRSYRSSYIWSLLQKLTVPLAVWSLAGIVGAWYAYREVLHFDPWHLLSVGLPPTVFLAGLAFSVSAFTLNTPISVMIPFGWWAFESITGSKKSGLFALLPYSMKLDTTPTFLHMNRVALVVAGCAMLTIGLLWTERRELPTVED